MRHLADEALADLQSRIERAGGLILPGGVDAHTHLREPGQRDREGILNGSRAAAAGGVTTLLDMPNNLPPCDSAARLAAKRRRFARQCQVRWGLHVLAHAPRKCDLGHFASAKVYMSAAGSSPAICDPSVLDAIFRSFPRITLHAEDQRLFRSEAGLPHHEARPREAVVAALANVEAVLRAIPRGQRPRLVLCHAATVEEVAWLGRLKAEGFDLWGETCPHYLMFSQEGVESSDKKAWYQVNPPIRREADRHALREALRDGTLDFVSSDHAPHRPVDKASTHPPSGIAGIEWTLPVLLGLVDEGLISWDRLLDLWGRAARRCFGIPLEAGDFTIVAPSAGTPLPPVTRAGFDPYGALSWTVVATFVGGRPVHLRNTEAIRLSRASLLELLGPGFVARFPHFFPSSRHVVAPEIP